MAEPFFFLHIPRTAGTTLNSILKDNFSEDETLAVYSKDDYERYRVCAVADLEKIRLITGHLLLETNRPPSIYGMPVRVFTFLRNPVGRLISEYDFLRSWQSNHLYSFLNDNNISFKEYLTSTEQKLFYRGKNFMTRCISGESFGGEGYPAEALEIAKENLEKHIACFGIQEYFFESLILLSEFLGLKNIFHEKRNALKTEVKTPLSDEHIAIIHDLNRADIELYEFAVSLFKERIAARGPLFQEKTQKLKLVNQKFQKISRLLQQRAQAPEHDDILFPKDGVW